MTLRVFEWFTENAIAAKNYVANTFSSVTSYFYQASSIASAVYNSLPSFFGKNDLIGLIRGVSVPADLQTVGEGIVNGPKTRRVFGFSLWMNGLLYMTSAMAYQYAKSLWRNIPGAENSYTEHTLDFLAFWYFLRLSWRMMAVNGLNGSSEARVVSEEFPNEANFPPCPCGTVPVVRGNLAGPAYYAGMMFFIDVLSYHPYLKYATWPLLAQGTGSVITESLVTNQCTKHRYETLAKNNAFSFGVGAAFLITLEFLTWLTRRLTGIQNSTVTAGLFGMLFQYFILATMLTKKPLPGQEIGLDVFSRVRVEVEALLQKIAKLIKAAMEAPPTETDVVAIAQNLWNHRRMQPVKRIFLYDDYHNLDSFAKSPEMAMFFEMKGGDFEGFLQWLLKVRHKKWVNGVNNALQYVKDFIPERFLSPDVLKIAQFALDKKLEPTIVTVRDFISAARIKVRIHQPLPAPADVNNNYIEAAPALPNILVATDRANVVEEYGNNNNAPQNPAAERQEGKEEQQEEPPSVTQNPLPRIGSFQLLEDWCQIGSTPTNNNNSYTIETNNTMRSPTQTRSDSLDISDFEYVQAQPSANDDNYSILRRNSFFENQRNTQSDLTNHSLYKRLFRK